MSPALAPPTLNISAYDVGDIVTIDDKDYVVMMKNGIKEIQRYNDDWHNDIHEIRSDKGVFASFISEFLVELPMSFPKLAKTLTMKQKLEMAACLWKKYASARAYENNPISYE